MMWSRFLVLLNTREALILLGAFLGVGTGLLHNDFLIQVADGFSTLFINFLKLVSLPIIFLSIVSNLSGLGSLRELKTMGRRVLWYALLTTTLAALVALFLVLVLNPANTSLSHESVASLKPVKVMDYLVQFVPDNLFMAFSSGNVIGIVVISFALGLAILMLPVAQRETLHQNFAALFAALLKMVEAVLFVMPVAVWAFIVLLMRDLGQDVPAAACQVPEVMGGVEVHPLRIRDLVVYLMCVVGANLLQAFLILPAFLKAKGVTPLKIARGVFPALSLAFFSKSSSATLPTTLRCVQENLHLSKRVSSFALPLCATINMNGCAAFILTTVLFVAGSQGMVFSTPEYIGLTLLAVVGAFGNAAVPMGCFFVASAFLAIMNMPLYIMGLIFPVYALIDMLETAINVWSDVCVTVVVDQEVASETL